MILLKQGQQIGVNDPCGQTIVIRTDGEPVVVDRGSTGYLICAASTDGEGGRIMAVDSHPLNRRIYRNQVASLPGPIVIQSMIGIVIIRVGYVAIPTIAGPIEDVGRLKYIDGCTDSLLISPPRLGDPCMNHLHFPPRINQTMHTHPSVRAGMILRGYGKAILPGEELDLLSGMAWVLPAEQPHCFATSLCAMDVIAYHPDSDAGPSDQSHPMINRTIVNGISAAEIEAIRTK